MSEYILELKNIYKNFGSVKALSNVNFKLKKGEVHALMGENGAGKSTFIKIITGVFRPDGGQIFLNGKAIFPANTSESQKMGIAAISTAFSLIHDKSVEKFEKKKNGSDYDKKEKDSYEEKTDYEINVHKKNVGTAVRIILALLAFAVLGAVAVCVFGGYTAKLPLLMQSGVLTEFLK